jgi:peptidoglycan hydrolase-like protein with peptidoglycan-binding domain
MLSTTFKRQRPALLSLSLMSLCVLQAAAAVHTDPNGNVGYDTLAECVTALESGKAKFYTPFTSHPPLKRVGEVEVRPTELKALSVADYSKGTCDVGVGRSNGRDGVSAPLIGKFVPYGPNMPVNAYFDATGKLVRASMLQCDNNFSGAFPRPLGVAVSNTDCFVTVQIPAKFETKTERVVKVPETTRLEVIPATYKTVTEQILVTPEIKKQISVPATYKTVQETVVTQPASEREEPVAATYKTVSERVLVKPESKRLEVVPATYKTVSEKVLVTPERKSVKVIPAQYVDREEIVEDRPATTIAQTTPATFKTVVDKVLVKPESVSYVPLPLPMKTVREEVTSRQASSRMEVIPATYKTVTEQIEIKPASKRIETIGPVFETVTERIKIADARKEWKRGRAWIGQALDVRPLKGFVVGTDNKAVDGNRVDIPAAANNSKAALETRVLTGDNSNLDDDVLCLVEIPEQYQTISRQVLKTPASTREVNVPAEYTTVTRRVIDREGSSKEIAIPGQTQSITRQVIDVEKLKAQGYRLDENGDIVATPQGDRVLRAASLKQASDNKAIEKTAGAESGEEAYVREVKTPAQYANVSRQVLDQPARVNTIEVPGTTKIVKSRVEASPAKTEEIVVAPAVYANISKQVLDTPATTREVTVPAEYRTVERQVVDVPASVRKVAVPAVTQVISRRVIDQAASIREEVVPATYKPVTRQVVDAAPSLREIKIPAQYEDLQYQVKVADARLERRAILCETNATPSKIMQIQRALLAAGYNPGSIDGVIRANTMSAVNAYQKAKGLPVDGYLNLDTVKALGISAN